MLNTQLTTIVLNKASYIVNYFFYLNKVYRYIFNKKYFGEDFFDIVKTELLNTFSLTSDFISSIKFKQYCKYLDENICPIEAQRKILIAKYSNKNIPENILNTFNFYPYLLDIFFTLLVKNFYKFYSSSGLKLFSWYKLKDNSHDNSKFLLLGSIKLEKIIDFSGCYIFNDLFKYSAHFKNEPIGIYLIFVKCNFMDNELTDLVKKDNKYLWDYYECDERINFINKNIHSIRFVRDEQEVTKLFTLL